MVTRASGSEQVGNVIQTLFTRFTLGEEVEALWCSRTLVWESRSTRALRLPSQQGTRYKAAARPPGEAPGSCNGALAPSAGRGENALPQPEGQRDSRGLSPPGCGAGAQPGARPRHSPEAAPGVRGPGFCTRLLSANAGPRHSA